MEVALSAPEVTIVGAGGIGCALGHALLEGGVKVAMVEADPAKLAWGSRHGIAVDDRPPAWRWLELGADGRLGTQLRWLEGDAS